MGQTGPQPGCRHGASGLPAHQAFNTNALDSIVFHRGGLRGHLPGTSLPGILPGMGVPSAAPLGGPTGPSWAILHNLALHAEAVGTLLSFCDLLDGDLQLLGGLVLLTQAFRDPTTVDSTAALAATACPRRCFSRKAFSPTDLKECRQCPCLQV